MSNYLSNVFIDIHPSYSSSLDTFHIGFLALVL